MILTIVVLSLGLGSCEKEITVEVPNSEPKLVIEGRIESDGINETPPFITLTKSTGYFETTSFSGLTDLQVHNAVVTIKVDNVTYPLEELCVSSVPPSLIPDLAEFLGVSEETLNSYNYCVYTVPLTDLLAGNFLSGEVGKTYYLTVVSEGITYTSRTKIPVLNKLNSVWYEPAKEDTFGFAWANMTEPDTTGNGYRWYAKRLSHTIDGDQKDDAFIPPAGSAFDDKFINAITFDFAYDRGHPPGDHTEEYETESPHYFKRDDTIAIKFCTIDYSVYRFLRVFEIEISSAGSPFASPSTIPTNIEGGALGLWAGYGVTYDTIYGVD
ncbi:MAG: DUF4249 family protein [Flavobacteriales bacterium]|nr:DUF4249 family protein [Flavobacteriales bacterium]